MPVLACNPILISLSELQVNKVIGATIEVTSLRDPSIKENMNVKLRSNASGNVDNFDLSPFVAGVCRKHFIADKEANGVYTYYKGNNQWKYEFKVGESVKASDVVLFGAGAVTPGELTPPYLLRRNTSTLHFYKGLPMFIAQVSPMEIALFYEEMVYVKTYSYNYGDDVVNMINITRIGLPVGKYYLVSASSLRDVVWDDNSRWIDADYWNDNNISALDDALVYPLVVHPSPADCLRSGANIYVRYWNSRGMWSFALLDVQHNDLKAKTTYADAWRLDAEPVNGRIIGDRVQTDKEMTYTVTAGRDCLDRLDVDELRDMQRSYCVQVWDIDREAWRDCYVQDATTRNAGGRGQEMTFTLEMPHEYTFTR